jgi:RNA ligase (TIGR02306 family)
MKLCSIERIKSVDTHPNADSLDIATVLGYKAIVKRGQYKNGDLICFIQPDCVLPDAPWATFYKSKSSRTKAIKLRGSWSLGIIESLDNVGLFSRDSLEEGYEVSQILGITKYEPPAPRNLDAKGLLPFGIFKTDEERFQNLESIPYGEIVDVSLKYDGSSASYAFKNDEFAICSRSLQLKEECFNKYTKIAQDLQIKEKLTAFCQKHKVNLCLRGEMFGSGIQGLENNPHSKKPLGFALFSVLNLDTLKYELKDSPFYFTKVAAELGLEAVKIIEENVALTPELINKYDELINKVDGNHFEGVVIKGNSFSFKVINKHYDSLK